MHTVEGPAGADGSPCCRNGWCSRHEEGPLPRVRRYRSGAVTRVVGIALNDSPPSERAGRAAPSRAKDHWLTTATHPAALSAVGPARAMCGVW